VNRIKAVSMSKRPMIVGLAAVLVALLVAPSAAAVEPRGGTWSGTTAQGLPIKFVVKKNPKGWKVVYVEYQVQSTCTGSGPDQPTITTTATATRAFPVLRADGTVDSGNIYTQRRDYWGWGHSGGGALGKNVTTVEGKFLDPRKARGKLTDEQEKHLGFADLVCQPVSVRWTAHR
jgi:hypothetical protein